MIRNVTMAYTLRICCNEVLPIGNSAAIRAFVCVYTVVLQLACTALPIRSIEGRFEVAV